MSGRWNSPTDAVKDYDAIARRLELTPVSLNESLWTLFRRFRLCSTASEESFERFQRATSVGIGSNVFSNHVLRALRALMVQEPALSNLKIVPVNSGNLGIVADYHNGMLKIDQKWFSYEGSHESGYCEHQSEGVVELKKNFSCDHVVLWLWEHVLKSFRDEHGSGLEPARQAYLINVARTKIQQMPRAVTFYTNEARNELYVRWISMEPHKNADKFILVMLHSPMCEYANEFSSTLIYKASAGMLNLFKSQSPTYVYSASMYLPKHPRQYRSWWCHIYGPFTQLALLSESSQGFGICDIWYNLSNNPL
jgi:hypothetical protein